MSGAEQGPSRAWWQQWNTTAPRPRSLRWWVLSFWRVGVTALIAYKGGWVASAFCGIVAAFSVADSVALYRTRDEYRTMPGGAS